MWQFGPGVDVLTGVQCATILVQGYEKAALPRPDSSSSLSKGLWVRVSAVEDEGRWRPDDLSVSVVLWSSSGCH